MKLNQTNKQIIRLGMLMALVFLVACAPNTKPKNKVNAKAFVSRPIIKNIPLFETFTGRFAADEEVSVVPRVSGHLESIHFTDGQEVKKGDLLFTLDQKPYIVAVNEAKADLELSKSTKTLAQKNFNRSKKLYEQDAISKQEYDEALNDLKRTRAEFKKFKALVERAELELSYTEIRSPIDGVIERNLISVGNFISPNSSSLRLAKVLSNQKLNFYFELSESQYIAIAVNGLEQLNGSTVEVEIFSPNASEKMKFYGEIDYIAHSANRHTATIRGRAVFKNTSNLLRAGLFGKASVQTDRASEKILVPDHLITASQSDRLIKTVNDQNKVLSKKVTLGPLVDKYRVILGGLDRDDLIITKNSFLFKSGQGVEIVNDQVSLTEEENQLIHVQETEEIKTSMLIK